jgi:multidrug efflux pump subunit AcrB
MNIAEYAIKKHTVTLIFTFILIVGGLLSYQDLGRLEDPEFTIKDALIITQYPGASAEEVENEVSDKIEQKIQTLSEVKEFRTLNKRGFSIITVSMKDQYGKNDLPWIRQKLRSKIDDIARELPPGATVPFVNDDFGDVYGILFALTGDGFSAQELKNYAKFIRKELQLVDDVAKIDLMGVQKENIFIELDRTKISSLGLGLDEIFASLDSQNTTLPSGQVKVGDEYISINSTGKITAVDNIKNIVIRAVSSNSGTTKLIYLKDIARVYQGYEQPTENKVQYNGNAAITIGVSTVEGGNVVNMGNAVQAKLIELQAQIPTGIELNVISMQSERVTTAINDFIINLVEAVAIVIVVLMLFMGLRSSLIIGSALFVIVMATFILMKMQGVLLERISLGALIIALGMLVDNSIVVIDGMLVGIQKGIDRKKVAGSVVAQNFWPLLGATAIAILAFGAIGMSQDSTGEYTRSLFFVILFSLSLSWLIAVTLVPLLGVLFIKTEKVSSDNADPYGNAFYQGLTSILKTLINHRWLTLLVTLGLLYSAIAAFGQLKDSFFPSSSRDQFMFHMYFPEDTSIDTVDSVASDFQKALLSDKAVKDVSAFIGTGAPRFLLTYSPEKDPSGYSFFVITVKDVNDIPDLMKRYNDYVLNHFPSVLPRPQQFALGPSKPAVEVAIYGENPNTLREIGEQVKVILQDNGATAVRSNWRERVKEIVPVFDEVRARDTGVTLTDFNNALEMNFKGLVVSYYKEDEELIPVVARASQHDRLNAEQINNIQVWSSGARTYIPIRQVVKSIDIKFVDAAAHRTNGKRSFTVSGDTQLGELKSSIFHKVRAPIEAIKLPDGYTMEWEGEFKSSNDAQAGLISSLPIFLMLMVLIVIMLFNSIKEPLMIWLTVPLALVGVGFGLFISNQPFDFMALLGFLSLSGMLIKNSIVLIDRINIELLDGVKKYNAIIHSVLTMTRPIAMGALTTVLGMLPLLGDVFFVAMAVTIMAGLAFATVLTLLFLPVLYAIFHNVETPKA